jgi:hypothetical protein
MPLQTETARAQTAGACGDVLGCPTKKEHTMSDELDDRIDIDLFFSLSYANYLVLHRSLLQSMPKEWQYEFVALVQQMDHHFRDVEQAPGYKVWAVGDDGRRIREPLPHYNRGRTFIAGSDDASWAAPNRKGAR